LIFGIFVVESSALLARRQRARIENRNQIP
jgi:hypothetical protein